MDARHSGSRSGPRWHVVYTRPLAEYEAYAHLVNQGWAPRLPRVLTYRRGRMPTLAPLFPRYLLIEFDPDADPWGPICSTRGVSALIATASGRPLALPPGEIERFPSIRTVGMPLIQPGEVVGVRVGDHELSAVCKMDAGERVDVMMQWLGALRRVSVRREDVVGVV
jgi:transcription antitermination factor NusG